MKNLSIILMVALLLGITKANAQVTIGSNTVPVTGAILDLKETESTSLDPNNKLTFKNAEKGIMMPRVFLTKYNDISELGITTDEGKLKATGMVVYNVNPDAEGIDEGLVQWSGEVWKSMGGSGVPPASIEDPDFSKIRIEGNYVAGHALRKTSNVMIIEVDVKRKGSYRITVEAIKNDQTEESNGYVFTETGEILATGIQEITLPGQGTPLESSDETGNYDYFEISINGKLYTTYKNGVYSLSNNVLKDPAEYTYDCSKVTLNGKYTYKTKMDNSNTITIEKVYNSGKQVEYHIYTDEINGIKFESRGTLYQGYNNITLEATGTPVNGGVYNYEIYTNSISANQACRVAVDVGFPTFKIQVYGETGVYTLYGSTSAIPLMIKNKDFFGLTGGQNPNLGAKVVLESITVSGATSIPTSIPADVDMVIVSYGANVDNDNRRIALQNFVNTKGKFLLVASEDLSSTRAFGRLFDSGLDETEEGEGANNMLLQSSSLRVDSIVKNGIYMNLAGKYIGRDGGGNDYFTNYSANWDAVAMSGANPRIIMHKKLPLILAGDGGIFSGGTGGSDGTSYPAWVDSQGIPQAHSGTYWTQPAHNAHLLLNIILWAVDRKINNQ